jgi:serine/tyrosine/threonine adenylyltransferase
MGDSNNRWRFNHSYTALPDVFFERVRPTPVAQPRMAVFNDALAIQLGLDPAYFQDDAGTEELAGNRLPEGAEPIAQAYAGHQFGHFTMLGDGRAILLGEHITPDNIRVDIQLKGSGQTRYSRRGDGRAALGPMLREYIISEAMHALDIPTTRSLAVVSTGEPVYRETPLPGAILTRVAASHLRVGTFQYAAALQHPEQLKALADYTINRHFPFLADNPAPYPALLEEVIARQARLIAMWMRVGFIHGVMNTDNMALSGETIDYGPCAFMDAYDPSTVFSSIDRHGRYAFGQQMNIALWNLARLAETLLPLIHDDTDKAIAIAEECLLRFGPAFQDHWEQALRHKIGLFNHEGEDETLTRDLLTIMQDKHDDYINTFHRLMESLDQPEHFCGQDPSKHAWWERWHARRQRQTQNVEEVLSLMQTSTPAVIPRNHRVEEALTFATEHQDYKPLHTLLTALRCPYDYSVKRDDAYQQPAPADAPPYCTYCGT